MQVLYLSKLLSQWFVDLREGTHITVQEHPVYSHKQAHLRGSNEWILSDCSPFILRQQTTGQKRRVVAVRRSGHRPERDALRVHRHRAFEALLGPVHRTSCPPSLLRMRPW